MTQLEDQSHFLDMRKSLRMLYLMDLHNKCEPLKTFPFLTNFQAKNIRLSNATTPKNKQRNKKLPSVIKAISKSSNLPHNIIAMCVIQLSLS